MPIKLLLTMKSSFLFRLATITAVTLTSLIPVSSVKAVTFDETQLDQNGVIAVARPYGGGQYDLLIIEQIPGKQQCWSESGTNPTVIEPLLLNFDFTGICNRATDSNGYSIRLDGQDYGLNYMLRIVQKNGELELVATDRANPSQEFIVGRTRGFASGFLKIQLEPGWRFSKRTYKGKKLGHFYFSGSAVAITNPGTVPNNPPTVPSNPDNVVTSNTGFKDISQDTYKAEIEQAVALGFVSGFKEDNTFRPEVPLTREQLVSMVIESLKTIPGIKIDINSNQTNQAFTDVDSSRWSASKIAWAQQNGIVSGYPDNTFQPTKVVTRAELMAVLQKAAQYAKTQKGLSPNLTLQQTAMNFSDVPATFWATPLITQMSSYCRVASPVNETGSNFAPQSPALRNYATTATLRMRNCVIGENK